MALDENLPESPEDKTVPKYRQIDKVSEDVRFVVSVAFTGWSSR